MTPDIEACIRQGMDDIFNENRLLRSQVAGAQTHIEELEQRLAKALEQLRIHYIDPQAGVVFEADEDLNEYMDAKIN